MQNAPAAPTVYSPCAKKWEFMHDAGLRRQFCDRCLLPVHNLSAMSKREAESFLERSKTCRTCITYELRRDGTMATLAGWALWRSYGRRLRRRMARLALVGFVARQLSRADLR